MKVQCRIDRLQRYTFLQSVTFTDGWSGRGVARRLHPKFLRAALPACVFQVRLICSITSADYMHLVPIMFSSTRQYTFKRMHTHAQTHTQRSHIHAYSHNYTHTHTRKHTHTRTQRINYSPIFLRKRYECKLLLNVHKHNSSFFFLSFLCWQFFSPSL